MPFSPKPWEDLPSTATPITAAALIDLEERVTDYARTVPGVINVREDHGAIGDGVADDSAAIQAAIDEAVLAGGAVVFIPRGVYSCLTALTIDPTSGVSLVGEDRWSTTLNFPVSPGADEACLDLGGTYAFQAQRIMDLSINGPGAVGAMGSFPANCYGVMVTSGWLLERVRVANCKAGFALNADHVTFRNCNASSNGYGVYWAAAPATYGDYHFDSTDLDGNTVASVGVAADNRIDGAIFTRCHFGNGPYCFLKESGAGDTSFILSTLFLRCGFESFGTSIIKSYNDRSVQATFIECQMAGAYNTDFDHPTDPKDALIDLATAGSMRLRVVGGNPFWKPGAAAIFKGLMDGCYIEGVDTLLDVCASDGKPVATGTVSNARLVSSTGELKLGTAGGTISQYDLVESNGYEDVKQYATADNKAPVGVAALGASTGQIVPYYVRGRTSVKRAGTNVPTGGRYLKPHASTGGAVDLASGYSDGPVVAVSDADSSGATVQATLRGLS